MIEKQKINNEYLIKEYDLLHKFYLWDLNSRFSIMKIYTTIVAAFGAIAAFVLRDGISSHISNDFNRIFICLMFMLSFMSGLNVIEFLISTKKSIIRILHKLMLIRREITGAGIIDIGYSPGVEIETGAFFQPLKIKKYIIDFAIILCAAQLDFLILLMFSFYWNKVTTVMVATVLAIASISFYISIHFYVTIKLKEIIPLLKGIEVFK